MAPFPPIDFILLDMNEAMREAWEKAFDRLNDDVPGSFTFVTDRLDTLQAPNDQFDCIVSPANSYGIMDGGFDHYLSKAFQPSKSEYLSLTHVVQAALYKEWTGFAPPGTCTLVCLPPALANANRYGCTWIAVVPTMRVPEDVRWNRDIIYDSMWSLLVALARHHDAAVASGEEPAIKKVVVTGLATGCGMVSLTCCAEQMALAVRHFLDARANEGKWSQLDWGSVGLMDVQIQKTRWVAPLPAAN